MLKHRLRVIVWIVRNLWSAVLGAATTPARRDLRRLVKEGRVDIHPMTQFYSVPIIKAFPGNTAKLVIKGYSSLTHNSIVFVGGQHPIDSVTTYPHRILWRMPGIYEDDFPTHADDSFIGGDVWMGDRSIVMPGIRIGHGAVIGSGSVVTKDVPDYAIVAGVPAKVIRYRFTEEQIEGLLETQWWEWPEDEVREAVPLLAGKDIDEFIAYARKRSAEKG